jgi:hypothetical protein
MKTLLGRILAFALVSELIAVFCYGGWIRWVLVAAILFTCGLLNLVSDGSFWGKAHPGPHRNQVNSHKLNDPRTS